MTHPTAIIHPEARVDASVKLGPYCVIDEGVSVGPGCVLGPYVHLTGNTTIGSNNRFFSGCVIGEAPQDLGYKDEPTRLEVGDHNTFREHVTVHRSSNMEAPTRIGSHTLLMAHSHVGHNSRVDDHAILANGVLLAGHVHIGERAFLSGHAVVHQHTRVGRLALMQGKAGIGLDLPPFTIASETNKLTGLNTIGLRRAGIPLDERTALKQIYRILFRSPGLFQEAVAEVRANFHTDTAREMIDFVTSSKRGVLRDPSASGKNAN